MSDGQQTEAKTIPHIDSPLGATAVNACIAYRKKEAELRQRSALLPPSQRNALSREALYPLRDEVAYAVLAKVIENGGRQFSMGDVPNNLGRRQLDAYTALLDYLPDGYETAYNNIQRNLGLNPQIDSLSKQREIKNARDEFLHSITHYIENTTDTKLNALWLDFAKTSLALTTATIPENFLPKVEPGVQKVLNILYDDRVLSALTGEELKDTFQNLAYGLPVQDAREQTEINKIPQGTIGRAMEQLQYDYRLAYRKAISPSATSADKQHAVNLKIQIGELRGSIRRTQGEVASYEAEQELLKQKIPPTMPEDLKKFQDVLKRNLTQRDYPPQESQEVEQRIDNITRLIEKLKTSQENS